jgi:hypothetical protein
MLVAGPRLSGIHGNVVYRLVPDVLKPMPPAHGKIQALDNDIPKRLQPFHKAAFAGSVIANKHGQRTEFDGPAVPDGLKILQPERAQWEGRHRINPYSAFG